jgi:hypothetical protein
MWCAWRRVYRLIRFGEIDFFAYEIVDFALDDWDFLSRVKWWYVSCDISSKPISIPRHIKLIYSHRDGPQRRVFIRIQLRSCKPSYEETPVDIFIHAPPMRCPLVDTNSCSEENTKEELMCLTVFSLLVFLSLLFLSLVFSSPLFLSPSFCHARVE